MNRETIDPGAGGSTDPDADPSSASSSADFHPDFLGEMCRRLALSPYPDTRQFVVQHLFPDTVRLLRILHDIIPIDTVIGISYSGDARSIEALRTLGVRVLTPAYAELEETVDRELRNSIDRCRAAGHRLVIHEVGGFAIRALHEPRFIGEDVVIGALEVTKQGVWAAEQLSALRIPQLNIAQTRLKRVEGKLVGEAVVAALDTILREIGYACVGRDALVCGYGWVGQGVARSLARKGLSVCVNDPDPVTLAEAAVDGFPIISPDAFSAAGVVAARRPAIVVGASGRCSIGADLIDCVPDRCFLVSGGSKNHEIDLDHLGNRTRSSRSIHPHVLQCNLDDGRRLLLVNEGYPVNFTSASVPDEIVEFLFAEMIMLIPKLMDDTPPPGIHTLPPEDEALPARIWLALR